MHESWINVYSMKPSHGRSPQREKQNSFKTFLLMTTESLQRPPPGSKASLKKLNIFYLRRKKPYPVCEAWGSVMKFVSFAAPGPGCTKVVSGNSTAEGVE